MRPACSKHLQVLETACTVRERLGKLVDGRLPTGQPFEDRPAAGAGEAEKVLLSWSTAMPVHLEG
jgi:hypothetical protein